MATSTNYVTKFARMRPVLGGPDITHTLRSSPRPAETLKESARNQWRQHKNLLFEAELPGAGRVPQGREAFAHSLTDRGIIFSLVR